ncbi:MAG: aminodeoxychorismate lyase [Gammaproteobacteria bacterium]|nr:aminodeoxychorismate lyase [Gammaproteobacteria bacterium]
MSQWFQNGEAVWNVSIDDRAFQYGDGLFETIAIRNGKPRLWGYHMDRLAGGCERLQIKMPDVQTLRNWLDDAVRDSDEASACCVAKLIISSGVSARGYGRPQPADAETFVGVFAPNPVATENYREGIETILCSTRLAPCSETAGLKTLNRLEQVLARSECDANGAFEGLTLDADDRLICGTMSNVFIISGESIITPSLDRCGVAGVMRRHTIETLGDNGIDVEIRDVSEAELFRCDELFLTNSQFGILPVRRCSEKVWRSHPDTRSIMTLLANNGIGECGE